jgi:hypothetical protein
VKTYTFSKARQNLASVLNQAKKDGVVRISRRDGQAFEIRPEQSSKSPLDVPGIRLSVTTNEIVQIVREGRKRYGRSTRLKRRRSVEEP